MEDENEDTDFLLEEISPALLMPEQDARWRKMGDVPTYRLLLTPIFLQQLSDCGPGIAIWMDFGALVYVSAYDTDDAPDTRQIVLALEFGKQGPRFHIVGRTQDGVSRTAAFFMSLLDATEEITYLRISTTSFVLDFTAARYQCLTRIFEIAPYRYLQFEGLLLSGEQLIVLATRSHPVRLVFKGCKCEDEGTSFVHAVENRLSPFGRLTIDRRLLSDANLMRLLEVDVIQHLGVHYLEEELLLLPFSARMDSLECRNFSSGILEDALPSLNIVANKISFSLYDDRALFPPGILLFLQRVAELGHFVELKFGVYGFRGDIPESVVKELIRAVLANRDLVVLDLSSNAGYLNWAPHLPTLFEGLKHHSALRCLKLSVALDAYGPNDIYLWQLLSHKRDLLVITYD